MLDQDKLAITLTPEMTSILREAMSEGGYASPSDVFHDALLNWREQRTVPHELADILGRLWDEGLASGEPLPADEAFGRIQAKIDALKP